MHRDSISVLPEGVLLAGLEADPMAHRRASQPCLAVPHDLASGVRIVLAGAVSAEMGDEPLGVAQPVRGGRRRQDDPRILPGQRRQRLQAPRNLKPPGRVDKRKLPADPVPEGPAAAELLLRQNRGDPLALRQAAQGAAGVVHIFGSSGCNAASPPIEEVGPAPVFEAAFDGEQGVGTRRLRVFGNCPGIEPC